MKREELLKSKEYWIFKIQNDLFGFMESYMKENKLNRTELASKLNVTKGYVSQIFNGEFDHKISKLVDLSLSCGKVPVITFLDLDKYINDDKEGKTHYLDKSKPIQYVTNVHIDNNVESTQRIQITQQFRQNTFQQTVTTN